MKNIGFILLIAGAFIFLAGLLFFFSEKIPWLGHLPGDIHLKGKNFSFHFPLVTCLLISLLLTILINIILKFLGK